jgi:hypothetical protein
MLYYSYKDNLGRQIIANSWKRPYFMDDTEIKVYIKDDAGNYKSPTKDEWVRESKAEIEERKRVNDLINSCFKTDWRDKFILWIKKHL